MGNEKSRKATVAVGHEQNLGEFDDIFMRHDSSRHTYHPLISFASLFPAAPSLVSLFHPRDLVRASSETPYESLVPPSPSEKPRQSEPRAKPLASSSDRRVPEQWQRRAAYSRATQYSGAIVCTTEMGKLLRHLKTQSVLVLPARATCGNRAQVTSRGIT